MKLKIVLLLAVVSIATIGLMPTKNVHAQDAGRKIEITAHRFAFSPAEITIKKGEPVVLVLKSTDVSHGLRFRELNAETKIPAGGTVELPLQAGEPGDFVGHCAVFCGAGHGEMTLTVHVVE
jgi:cytochrome c oxidase subunit 2